MAKIWLNLKIAVISALALYVVLFVYNNSSEHIQFWYWFNHRPEMNGLFLAFGAFLFGVVLTLLVRTTWKTYRQISTLQTRNRTQKLEREVSDMRLKAAMLQTRPDGAAAQELAPPKTPLV